MMPRLLDDCKTKAHTDFGNFVNFDVAKGPIHSRLSGLKIDVQNDDYPFNNGNRFCEPHDLIDRTRVRIGLSHMNCTTEAACCKRTPCKMINGVRRLPQTTER